MSIFEIFRKKQQYTPIDEADKVHEELLETIRRNREEAAKEAAKKAALKEEEASLKVAAKAQEEKEAAGGEAGDDFVAVPNIKTNYGGWEK